MLISYRDSKRYPSEALALQAWVKIAEAMAREVVCREFDALQFARVLELCRHLTLRNGPEAIRRMVAACAAAGVAVVVVPGFAGCHANSASRWLVRGGGGGRGRRAMIALSLRYRRDDQLYFSLFREAGAILMADKLQKSEVRSQRSGEEQFQKSEDPRPLTSDRCPLTSACSPDRFARELLIPPDHDGRLAEIAGMAGVASASSMSDAIEALADDVGIAPGLVVGRLQHDALIPWTYQNALKREVDLSFVLRGAEAAEETWPNQTTATRQVMGDFGLEEAAARERVRRAAAKGDLLTNGQQRKHLRIEPGRLAAWRLAMRDRDLDTEEREEAA